MITIDESVERLFRNGSHPIRECGVPGGNGCFPLTMSVLDQNEGYVLSSDEGDLRKPYGQRLRSLEDALKRKGEGSVTAGEKAERLLKAQNLLHEEYKLWEKNGCANRFRTYAHAHGFKPKRFRIFGATDALPKEVGAYCYKDQRYERVSENTAVLGKPVGAARLEGLTKEQWLDYKICHEHGHQMMHHEGYSSQLDMLKKEFAVERFLYNYFTHATEEARKASRPDLIEHYEGLAAVAEKRCKMYGIASLLSFVVLINELMKRLADGQTTRKPTYDIQVGPPILPRGDYAIGKGRFNLPQDDNYALWSMDRVLRETNAAARLPGDLQPIGQLGAPYTPLTPGPYSLHN
ncbi:hypothetical protein COT48_02550 [Candidatus Woesearchaeota archaeon CG08_land_8_20_14_0_20_47_9]|nr:MAG: hypothetical protein AUJ69_04080 [Candidatus Woesearchaeota archaeon CG1_02_47_18]PIO04020.1 MAG: hypothetical protein COT48_02550 [Candidatus Woesearchaeota archaeon CG08_land_8_20_14_0_20_47_9]